MAKVKPLLPSLREKKRYVVYEVTSKRPVLMQDVAKKIAETYQRYFGIYGSAQAGIMALESSGQRGILRISNKHVDRLKAIFPLIHKIEHQEILIQSVGVSGILKKAKKQAKEGKYATNAASDDGV